MPNIALVGGPRDGDTVAVGEPWPRETWLYEDPADDQIYTYQRDVADDTEPYTFNHIEVTDYIEPDDPETDEVSEIQEALDSTGMQGEPGVVGERGPPGLDGADGDNLGWWTHPGWAYFLSQYGYRPDGWPADMIPADESYGRPSEPLLEHFFDTAEVNELQRMLQRQQQSGNFLPTLSGESSRLPEGWYSPSGKRRYWAEDWCPGYAMWHTREIGAEDTYATDFGGFFFEANPNPRHDPLHWHASINGWYFRGYGFKVQLWAFGTIEGDPYEFYTRPSVETARALSDSGELVFLPGAEVIATDASFAASAPRLRMQRLATLDPLWRPMRDIWIGGQVFSARILSLDTDYSWECAFLLQADGELYLVESGPTEPPRFYWGEYEFFAEYEAAASPLGAVVVTP